MPKSMQMHMNTNPTPQAHLRSRSKAPTDNGDVNITMLTIIDLTHADIESALKVRLCVLGIPLSCEPDVLAECISMTHRLLGNILPAYRQETYHETLERAINVHVLVRLARLIAEVEMTLLHAPSSPTPYSAVLNPTASTDFCPSTMVRLRTPKDYDTLLMKEAAIAPPGIFNPRRRATVQEQPNSLGLEVDNLRRGHVRCLLAFANLQEGYGRASEPNLAAAGLDALPSRTVFC